MFSFSVLPNKDRRFYLFGNQGFMIFLNFKLMNNYLFNNNDLDCNTFLSIFGAANSNK